MDTDVLIIGAGPTGLMLANQLTRRGVRTLLVERHAGPSRQTRALGVQARTLEIYAQLGLAERAVALGKPGNGAHLWAQGRRMGHVPLIDVGSTATAFPYLLVLGQDDNERILGEHLIAQGGAVQWSTELIALVQHDDQVAATVRLPDGSERIVRARYVAGCDGARSPVRELNGIGFPGGAYEHVFYVADVQASGRMVADEVNVCLWKRGFHLFFPMRGQDHWRIVGMVPAHLRDRDDLAFGDVDDALEGSTGLQVKVSACSWFSTYRIQHRRAAHFRAGRCFLLGDAAHVHSPVGAQGMNTGLQDAYNLAWKLALVVQGRAHASLLDSYEAERVPVARRLLDTTDRAFRFVVSDSWLAGLLRTRVLARVAGWAMRRRAVQERAFRTVSQIGIHYRHRGLSLNGPDWSGSALQAGDRFPWLHLVMQAGAPAQDLYAQLPDTQFHLLVFGQHAAPQLSLEWSDLLRVHVLPDLAHNRLACQQAGIPPQAYFLLRPDGHIGLCGREADMTAVHAYLSEHVGLL